MPTEPTPTKSSLTTTGTTTTSTLGKRKQAPMTTSPSQEQRLPQRTSRDYDHIGDEDEEKEQRPLNVQASAASHNSNNNSDSEHDHNESAASEDDHRDGYDSEEEEEYVIDRKNLLIVKDGTIRVAESLEQQQFDTNGEAIKASGTWTKAEHDRFLKAMETYPKGPWKAIAAMVGSRTVRQTQTHAQKYREKMARRMRGLRNRNGTLQYPASSSSVMMAGADAAMYGYGSSSSGMGTVMSHDRMTAVYQPASAMAHGRHHHFPHQQHQQHSYQQQLYQAMPAAMAMVPTHGGPMVSSSMEFSQLSKASISSAFIGNPSYPPAWDPHHGAIAPVPLVMPSLPQSHSQPQLVRRSTSSSSSPETRGAARPLPVTAPPVSVPGAAAGSSSSSSSSATGRTPKDPDFDESMDFLMHVYSANPQQLGDTALPNETAFFKRE